MIRKISKKGVSPLIATVLLISISVMLSYIILSWSVSLTKEETTTITNKTKEQVECGVLLIKDVYMDFTSNISRVYIWSSNAIDQITSAIMLTKNGEQLSNLTILPMNITKGELKVIQFNLTGKISTCSNFSQVIISTRCITDKFDSTPKC